VFVVGYLGNWQRAAAVLFERHSLQGHPAPSRETRQDATTYTSSSIAEYRADNVGGTIRANGGDLGGGSETFVAKTLTAGIGKRNDFESDTFAVEPVPYDFFQITAPVNRQSREPGDPCHTLARDNAAHATIVQPTYGIPGNWIGRQPKNGGNAVEPMHDVSPCLTKTDRHGIAQPINIYGGNKRPDRPEGGFYVRTDEPTSKTLDSATGLNPTCSQGGTAVMAAMQVRRLTPVECERLQGFPDGYTNIPWRNKTESPDGSRYKAMGNSMAVPVMRWIGERIAAVEAL
jgi:DNA (cytosine-5)-methyltransferase 1